MKNAKFISSIFIAFLLTSCAASGPAEEEVSGPAEEEVSELADEEACDLISGLSSESESLIKSASDALEEDASRNRFASAVEGIGTEIISLEIESDDLKQASDKWGQALIDYGRSINVPTVDELISDENYEKVVAANDALKIAEPRILRLCE